MRRHLVRFALISATLSVLVAAPGAPAGAEAESSAICFYVIRSGSGLTICL